MSPRRLPAEWPSTAPKLLRIRAVSEATGLSYGTIAKYCQLGRIRSVRINSRGDRLVVASEIDRLIALADAGEPLPDRAP